MIPGKRFSLLFLTLASVIVAASLHSQASEQTDVSSMQWANASAVQDIKFTLLGDTVANPWRPGGQVGAGQRGTLQWTADFTTSASGSTLKESLELKPGQSGAAVLVGDFAEQIDVVSSGQLRPGYSKSKGGKFFRAALLCFTVGKARELQYPVHLVNGDPDNLIRVTVGGILHELEYAVPKSFKATVGQRVTINVSAPGLERELGFTLEARNRGGILAFYRPADVASTSFVFVNLRSMESIQEMGTAQSSSESD